MLEEDIAQLVNKDGILEGQCEAPEFFMNTLLTKIYGSQAVTSESGMTLKNTAAISRMGHIQTRLTLPEHTINTLIDVEPALSEVNLDPSKPITEPYKPPLEELLRQITQMSSSNFVTETPSLQNTEIVPQKSEEDVETKKQTTIDAEEKKAEDDKTNATEAPPRKEDITNPQTNTQEKEAAITIPEPVEPKETATEIQQTKKIERQLYAALSAFELELPLFLGLDHAYTDEKAYHQAVMKKMLPTLRKSKDTWQSTPHVQLYVIAKKYKDWERHKNWEESEAFSYPTEEINRLQRMIGHYKSKSRNLGIMIRQGKFPDYDPQFLETMEKAISAFTIWEESQEKSPPA